MILRLIRDYRGTDCTQGMLHVDEHEYHTMERPWVAQKGTPCGAKGVSCVPRGGYQLKCHHSEAHPHTWALVNPGLWIYHYDDDVPPAQAGMARTLVLIHPANFAYELRGCIAPGLARNLDGNKRMVSHSRAAMTEIESLVPWVDGEHTLEIA
jgi:hypothetical protein